MTRVIDLLNLFIFNSKLEIAKSIEYRFNFITSLVMNISFSCVGPLLQFLVFTQTNGFPGWSLGQMVLLQGIVLSITGFRGIIFGNLKNQFINIVRNGELDKFLTKPLPTIGILLSTSFSMESMGTFLIGIFITVHSIIELSIGITVWKIIMFAYCIVGGLLLYITFDILHCCLIMITVADGGIQGIINAYLRFAEYPLEIFPNLLQSIFIYLVPIAIMAYFPAQVLLGRADPWLLLSFIGIFALLFLSIRFWDHIMKKYTSAGG